MKRSLLLVLGTGLIAGSVAADPALVAAAAPAPAAAAAPAIKFSGDMQFRLRFHWTQTAQDTKTSTGDYLNVYMWNFEVTAQPTEDLLVGIRLSNPSGASCDPVPTNLDTVSQANGTNLLVIPEFYLKWTYSIMALWAGILPVSGSTVLDLMGYENDTLAVGRKLIAPFDVTMNNSQKGVILGTTFLKDEETTIGANLLVAMAKDAARSPVKDVMKLDQWRFLLRTPISLSKGMIGLQPSFMLRTNVARSTDLEKANVSMIGGIDATIKPVKEVSAKVGAAFGGYNTDAMDTGAVMAPRGLIAVAGLTVSPGLGTVMLDYNYSMSKDMIRAPGLNYHQNFVDLKYAIPVKKFAVIPRLRWWYLTSSKAYVTANHVRPELIFKAAF